MSASPKNCGAHEFEFRGASSDFGERDESPIYDFTGVGRGAQAAAFYTQKVMFLPLFVCLSVCLSISRKCKKIVNRFSQKFVERIVICQGQIH